MRRGSVLVSGLALAAVPSLASADETAPGNPVSLFSEPDYSEATYREASAEAAEFLARIDEYSRNMVVKTDADAFNEMINEFESNPGTFNHSFDVSAYSDVPCVVSSTKSTSPHFTPGSGTAPARYWVDAPCEQSLRTFARITVLHDQNAFKVVLNSQDWGAFTISSIGDWEYSLAYRNDDSSENLLRGRLGGEF